MTTRPAFTQLLLKEPEAAAALGLCPRTLREARKAGKLRYVLIGRAVRYTPEDITAYIDSLRQVEPPCPAEVQKRTKASSSRSGQVIPFHRRKAVAQTDERL